jgi:hypothetical protein
MSGERIKSTPHWYCRVWRGERRHPGDPALRVTVTWRHRDQCAIGETQMPMQAFKAISNFVRQAERELIEEMQ